MVVSPGGIRAHHATSADGTRIGYLTQGAGPAVVLSQGAMADVHAYRDLAATLTQTCTVVSLERRGRGLSPRDYDPTHDLARDVEDVDAVLRATGAHALFGLSSGAVITLAAARRLDSLERIAVYEPPFYAGGIDHAGIARIDAAVRRGDLPSALLDALLTAGTAPPLLARLPRRIARQLARGVLAVDAARPGPRSSLRALLPGVRFDFHDVAQAQEELSTASVRAGLKLPVLVLSGTRSPLFLRQAAARLAADLPDADHVILDGLGHDGPWNGGGPTQVADAFTPFLRGA